MNKLKPLHYKLLSSGLDPRLLDFETSDDVTDSIEYLGQERAFEAINLGIGIKSQGYNFFVMGPSGMGKRALIRNILKLYAETQTPPDDWCYVHNFQDSEKPKALKLPTGRGLILKQAMDKFIEDLKTNLLSLYESEEYRVALEQINVMLKKKIASFKKNKNKGIKLSLFHKDKYYAEKKLQEKLTNSYVGPEIVKIQHQFSDLPKVISYLDEVKHDIVQHANELIKHDIDTNMLSFDIDSANLIRYQVNLFVNNKNKSGVPVIIEDNPSYSNLISRLEYKMQAGTMTTNFTLLKAGALHRANGGFLILEARKVKRETKAWESLKNALYTGKITIESSEDDTESKPTSIEPKPIPLKVKIVLVGDRNFYYRLSRTDSDFNELFKVAVDLDDTIDRNKKNMLDYARLICTTIQKRNLRPFDRSAIAAIIDYSSRLADDSEKLSHHISRIDEIILEANYWAKDMRKKVVDAVVVKRAIAAKIYRMDRSRASYYEDIQRDFILINTKTPVIGQINCLSVVRAGNFSYGHPTRITVRVRPGRGHIIDVQRNIRLAGPIHSKAILTITNYLASHYCVDRVFSLIASISFEQIYGAVDGDSASIAELCALISALAKVPISQSFAVTGSMNQDGDVQSVGCVNEKIEGFYDVCKAKGFTKTQGVIIPKSNIPNLMLRDDIVQACKQKKFFIYAITNVNEALFILTGLASKTITSKVEKRLAEYESKRLPMRKMKRD